MQRNSIYFMVISVLGLIVIGLVALSSTSAFAPDGGGDALHFVKRQSIWLVLGGIICVIAALVDYHVWRHLVWVIYAAAAILLAMCFIPPFGLRINGSARWVDLGFYSFQPSEFAKIAAIAFLAYWFSKYKDEAGTLVKGFVMPSMLIGVLLVLIVAEVDVGSTMLIAVTMVAMMFVAGTAFRYIFLMMGAAAGVVIGAVKFIPERLDRFMAFMDLEGHRLGAGLQQWQALIAFGSGGVDGLGLGNGRQKMHYLPYAHTDFIFPMIGEELGLRITLLIVFLYLVIFVTGTFIAVNARDRFGMLFGFGIVVITGLQAAVNIGVTTAMLPNKGLPLPYISYGGSNLLLCLLGIGILINIYRQGLPAKQVMKPASVLRARTLPRL